MSEKGNYVLAIIKTKEDCNCIRESLQNLKDDMKQLTTIEVDGASYEIEYFLGGIGNFWQQFVASVLQIKTRHAFGANAQELKNGGTYS